MVESVGKYSPVRAICIGSLLLAVGALWITVQELVLGAASLAASAPPVGALGLFIAVLCIALILQWFRKQWGLDRKELLIIYCMLVTFLPLASQGLWHRFTGIMISMYHPAVDAQVPPHVVPRGAELVANGRFDEGLAHWQASPNVRVSSSGDGVVVAVLSNEQADQRSDLMQWIGRRNASGEARFATRETFACLYRVRAAGFGAGSWFSASASIDGERWTDLRMPMARDTPAETVDASGFFPVAREDMKLPFSLDDGLWIRLRLTGPGRVEVDQVSLYSVEVKQRLLEGSYEVSHEVGRRLDDQDAARVFVQPEQRWGVDRLLYDVRSFAPWATWAQPIGTWALLWVAMFLAMYACAGLFFRQWSDHEKLDFPLTLIPLHLTATGAGGRGWPPVLRTRALWLGVLTAVVVYGFNGLHFYNSNFPGVTMTVDLAALLSEAPWKALLGDGQGFVLKVTLLAVGVAFLMDGQMAFNLWFFYLLCKVLLLVPYSQGMLDGRAWPSGPAFGPTYWQFQGIGAAVGIVLIALWLSRRHLWSLWLEAIGKSPTTDDGRQPLPIRLALAMLVGAVVLAVLWAHVVGVAWWVGAAIMVGMLALAIMASRVRAECAAPAMWLVPATPMVLVVALGGVLRFGMQPLIYVTIAVGFMCAGTYLMIMPALMETFQIAKVASIGRRVIGWAMVVGFVVAVTSGGYVVLNWGYARGLANMRGKSAASDGGAGAAYAADRRNAQVALNWRGELSSQVAAGEVLADDKRVELEQLNRLPHVRPAAAIVGGSTLVTIGLMAGRLTFLRFPFHPIGYAMATTRFMSYLWFSVFIAWAIRMLAIRLGGVHLIRTTLQPYMIGLIVGSVLAVLLWEAVAMVKLAGGYSGALYTPW